MRQIVLVMLILFFASAMTHAQTKVPKKVKIAFEEKFPTATNVNWDKEGKNEYEASFEMNGIKYSANFNKKGIWLETEISMTFSQLPDNIQKSFKANYNDLEIKGAAKIENSEGIIIYEIEYIRDGKTKEAIFNNDGSEIRK